MVEVHVGDILKIIMRFRNTGTATHRFLGEVAFGTLSAELPHESGDVFRASNGEEAHMLYTYWSPIFSNHGSLTLDPNQIGTIALIHDITEDLVGNWDIAGFVADYDNPTIFYDAIVKTGEVDVIHVINAEILSLTAEVIPA